MESPNFQVNKYSPQLAKLFEAVNKERNILLSEKTELEEQLDQLKDIHTLINIGLLSVDNILLNKDIIIKLNPDLKRSIFILNRFNELNNLNNDQALSQLRRINDGELKNTINNQVVDLTHRLDDIKRKEAKINDLLSGNDYNLELLEEIASKYNFSKKDLVLFTLFFMGVIEAYTKDQYFAKVDIEEIPKSKLEIYQEEYNHLSAIVADISAKHIELAKGISDRSKFFMRSGYLSNHYMSSVRNNMRTLDFNEGKTIACLLYVQELRDKIGKEFDRLASLSEINDKEYEQLEKMLNDYKEHIERLKEYDHELGAEQKKAEVKEDSIVCFALDEDNKPFIGETIYEHKHQQGLLNIINKINQGKVPRGKKDKTILKSIDKKFEKESGKTVYSMKNYDIVIAYVILNNRGTNGEDIIFIINADECDMNDFVKRTNDIIKAHRDTILFKIRQVEQGVGSELSNQIIVLDELLKSLDKTYQEGDGHGRIKK